VSEEVPALGPIGNVIALIRTSRKLVMNASYLVVQPILLNAISIPATAYIISSLGPLGYGQWAIALSLIGSAGVLSNMGVRSGFVRKVSRNPEVAGAAFADQVGLRLLLAALAGAAAVIACVAFRYPSTVLQCTVIIALGGLFKAVGELVADVLVAIGRVGSMALINTIAGLSLTLASVIAMWFGAGPLGLAASYVLGPVLTGILALILVQRQLFPVRMSWDVKRFIELLKESKALALQLFVGGFDAQVANLITPKLVGISEYGYYAAGTLLPSRLMVVPDGLNTAFFPVLSRAHREGPAAFRRSVGRYFFFSAVAGMAAAVPIFFLAGPIARLLFHKDPEILETVIRITIWWVPMMAIGLAEGYTVTAAFREAGETRISFITTLLSIPLTVFLITRFGLIGACLSLPGKALLNIIMHIPLLTGTLRAPDHAPKHAVPAEP
jgi:O-antigen/teichoic acid export membrane protein